MFTLSRYVIREHIGPFIFSFLIITLLFLLNILFRELSRLLSRGIELGVILEYFTLHMGWIIAITLPMAVLPAVLMSFGRFSADNEITAIKASGMSIYKIIIPVLFASAVLCALCIWFGNSILPNMNHRARLLTSDITRKRPTLSLEPGVVFDQIPDVHLTVREIEESEGFSKIYGIYIDHYNLPNVTETIVADNGEIRFDKTTGKIIIDLYNGEIQKVTYTKLGEMFRMPFKHYRVTRLVPGMVLTRSDSEYRTDREKSARDMLKTVRSNEREVVKAKEKIAEQMEPPFDVEIKKFFGDKNLEEIEPSEITRLLGQSFAKSSKKENADAALTQLQRRKLTTIRDALEQIRHYKKSSSKLMVEVHKKYSIPFACIVFVLIGAPMGIMARKGGMGVGGGLSIFFFLLYWTFLIGGEELADRRIISPLIAMWSANILVGISGLYLVFRTARDVSLINLNIFRKK